MKFFLKKFQKSVDKSSVMEYTVNTDSKGAVSEKFTTLITPLLFFLYPLRRAADSNHYIK